jgi:hypothetical protein
MLRGRGRILAGIERAHRFYGWPITASGRQVIFPEPLAGGHSVLADFPSGLAGKQAVHGYIRAAENELLVFEFVDIGGVRDHERVARLRPQSKLLRGRLIVGKIEAPPYARAIHDML